MITREARLEAQRLLDRFRSLGAEEVEAAILQPAAELLDLYGEDIRARAYVTADPRRGEMMLRPDFTLPVARLHMESGRDPARYAYAGEVFRRQDQGPERPSEFLQAGFELFGGHDPAEADAEVFAALAGALPGLALKAETGDIGLLTAAVAGLGTTEARKAALLRHLWRPRRFRALLDRFAGRGPTVTEGRRALLACKDPFEGVGPEIGLRSRAEVEARLEALREEAAAPPLSGGEVDLIDAVLDLDAPAPAALEALRAIARALPSIGAAVDRMARRLDALAARGVEVGALGFEGSFGLTTLEYYDGFVFVLSAEGRPDLPPAVTGGRYDALTRVLGRGRAVPAVGGVIRPEVVVALRDQRLGGLA